jgi:hypothetical protein
MDAKREAYPFAGALCVTAGALLAQIHDAAGPPPARAGFHLPDDQRGLAVAAATGYGAAAACAALSARLLLIEREMTCEQLPEVPRSRALELGVTIVESTEAQAWRATVRAAAAARAELEVCVGAWSGGKELTNAAEVVATANRLIAYIDELVAVLERIEPEDPSF